jgi:hypothetical protein
MKSSECNPEGYFSTPVILRKLKADKNDFSAKARRSFFNRPFFDGCGWSPT